VCIEPAEGVGERNIGFASERDGEGTGDIFRGMRLVAGRGVETPSALASFANLCGGNGWRGGGQTGRSWTPSWDVRDVTVMMVAVLSVQAG
jgi:hypothetical protein